MTKKADLAGYWLRVKKALTYQDETQPRRLQAIYDEMCSAGYVDDAVGILDALRHVGKDALAKSIEEGKWR